MRTAIHVVGEAITIAIPSASVGSAVVFGSTGLLRTKIVRVRDCVAIRVGAAVMHRQPGFIRTIVVSIGDAITIEVGATVEFARARHSRAFVHVITHPIAVGIPRYRATILQCQARLVRAGIVRIGYPVVIGIGTATRQNGSGLTRTVVVLVCNAVAVLIRLARRRTARGLHDANVAIIPG